MNRQEFNDIIEKQIVAIQNTLQLKQQEYSDGKDVLYNFNLAASLQHCSNVKALAGMMAKHTVSVYDIVENFDKLNVLPSIDMLDEKIGDSINYLILLKACFLEKIKGKSYE